jgi:6-phosphogluconate dehydrogenase
MQLGLVGLGRMGGNMRERVRRAGHEVVGFDRNPAVSDVANLAELAAQLVGPRVVWVMVPADVTEQTIDDLAAVLSPGDIVIDGGNSRFSNDPPRAERLGTRGIGYIDVGVSGGVWGIEYGYGLMVGGSDEHVAHCMPIFEALKPAGPFGFVHAGTVGAGHYTKMVHNGIEYGLMQAYAEGFEIMHASEYDLDEGKIAKLWMQGSVVRSWLLELLGLAFDADPGLDSIRGYVEDSGEGRWTVEQAIDTAVPAPVIALSLMLRQRSRQDDSYSAKVNAALRQQFGGHAVKGA